MSISTFIMTYPHNYQLTCFVEVDCGQPVPPKNGTVSVPSGTTLGAEVTFECNIGFKLDGNASNVCQPSKHWEPGTPNCQLICKILTGRFASNCNFNLYTL